MRREAIGVNDMTEFEHMIRERPQNKYCPATE
jgi:hypothetical protein